jgi:tryptophan-rich sensory protein
MAPQSRSKDILGLTGWLVTCYAVSAVGALATVQAQPFCTQMLQPSWAPPSWLFGQVWTALYTMMAIAAWLVWRSGGFRSNGVALCLFLPQLALNGIWSWLFFTWNFGLAALSDIIFLWLFISATLLQLWRVRPLAGALLIPYLLWVGYAAALTYALWQLNPGFLG